MRMPFRVGTGHDVHRLIDGHALVLGGVAIPSPIGFDTHSDGDVLCHALVDALAGAMADGDLGTHFPEDDPGAEDARSLDFVRRMMRLVRAEGYELANLDSFVVLGTTKLRPHLAEMRRNLAAALEVDLVQVSVKARSNDGLGDVGEGRACEAWATVLICPVGEPAPGVSAAVVARPVPHWAPQPRRYPSNRVLPSTRHSGGPAGETARPDRPSASDEES